MELRLTADADAPALARERLLQALGSCEAETKRRAELLMSELVTNAVRHGPGSGEIDVCVLRTHDAVKIVVSDIGVGFNPVNPPLSDGYGLAIIESLSREWGVVDTENEFRVWCVVEVENCFDSAS